MSFEEAFATDPGLLALENKDEWLVARRLRDVRLSYRHFERKREIFLADRDTMYV